MAGYLGTKTVFLSTTAANVAGDATISGDLTVDTDTLYVDSTNNRVGIGTSSPTADLHIVDDVATLSLESDNSNAQKWTLQSTYTNTGGSYGAFIIEDEAGSDWLRFDEGNGSPFSQFLVNGSEAMRIDSSGNLLVGKVSADATVTGGEIRATGVGIFTTTDGYPLQLRRYGSDGSIIDLRKDGSTVGSIGSANGNTTYFGRGTTGLGCAPFSGTNSSIFPFNTSTGSVRDNAIDLGFSSARFDDIYATNGTIQTSDRNEKQDIASLTPTEMLVAARLSTGFKNFRWKDSVAEKGAAARMHSGAIAQDVQDAFTAEGLDAGDYSMFISATWWTHDVDVPAVEAVAEVVDEDGVVVTEAVEAVAAYTRTDTYDTEAEAPVGAVSKTRLGVRYPELLSFVAAYNEQRFASIEARLTALEAV